jgi:chemosensory pili system protein ChpA (sensor histidine kinase/response regulator)
VPLDALPEFDPGPLSWVQGEIEHAITRGLECLAAYRVTAGDAAALTHARSHIHQAAGAIQMVGLDAVVVYTDEIERQLARIDEIDAAEVPAVVDAVDRACRKLQIFLDELVNGAPPVTLKLFPEYEAMQRARGVKGATPTDLFYPDLTARPPVDAPAPSGITADALPSYLVRQRRLYQRGMLAWLRGEPGGAQAMREAVAGIENVTAQPKLRSFWWTVRVCFDAIAAGGLDASFGVKQLAARIDLQVRRVVEGGAKVADRLRREVLYYVAISAPVTPAVQDVQTSFRLPGLIPSADALNADLLRIRPHLREAHEQLAAAKEAWLKFTSGRAENLPKLKQTLASVHRHVGEIGNAALTRLTSALVDRLDAIPSGYVSEPVAMEYATAMLLAESALENYASLSPEFPQLVDTMLARLDAAQASRPYANDAGAPLIDEMAKRAQERVLLAQIGREIQANLRHMEQVLDAFFRDHAKRGDLATLARDSRQIRGALRMLGLDGADQLLGLCQDRIESYADPATAVSNDDLELLAEALSGLGFYVEAVEQQRPDRERLIAPLLEKLLGGGAPVEAEEQGESVEAAVDALRSALPELIAEMHRAPADAAARSTLQGKLADLRNDAELIGDADLAAQARAALDELDAGGTAALAAAVTAITEGGGAAPTPEVSAETRRLLATEQLDAELVEIFLAEADEVLDSVALHHRILTQNPGDREALRTVRRGFHTLKGSGRMVGLVELGDLAYFVEKIHNRLLEEDRPVTAAVLALIGAAGRDFRRWVAALAAEGRVQPDAHDLFEAIRAVEFELPADRESVLKTPVAAPAAAAAIETPAAPAAPQIEIVALGADEGTDELPVIEPAFLAGIDSEPLAPALPVEATPPLPFGAIDEPVAAPAATDGSAAPSIVAGAGDAEPGDITVGDVTLSAALYQILLTEADTHLATLSHELSLMQSDARQRPSAAMVRASHTMCGIHRTGGFPLIAATAGVLEQCLLGLQQDEAERPEAALPVLIGAVTGLAELVDGVRSRRGFDAAAEARASAIQRDLESLRRPPAAGSPRHVDVDIDAQAAPEVQDAVAAPLAPAFSFSLDDYLREFEARTAQATPDAAAPAPAHAEVEVPAVLPELGAMPAGDTGPLPTADDAAEIDEAGVLEIDVAPAAETTPLPVLDMEPFTGAAQAPEFAVEPVHDETPLPAVDPAPDVTPEPGAVAPDDWHPTAAPPAFEIVEEVEGAAAAAGADVCAPQSLPAGDPMSHVAPDATPLLLTWVASPIDDVNGQAPAGEIGAPMASADREATEPDGDVAAASAEHGEQPALAGSIEAPAAMAGETAEMQAATVPAAADTGIAASQHTAVVVPLPIAAPAPPASPAADALADVRDDVDLQLLPIFLEEAAELFPQAGEQLRLWRGDPSRADLARQLRRTLHTFKGSARMAGAMRLGQLTHLMESRLLDGDDPAAATPELLEALDTDLDRVAFVLEALREGRTNVPLPWVAPAEAEAVAAAAADSAAGVQPAADTVPAAAAPAAVDAVAPAPVPSPPATVSATAGPPLVATVTPPAAELDPGRRALLRVRADVVDRLVNEAGEVAIARARVEGELRALKANLHELTGSVVRLRTQVREMEIQAESQIQSRLSQVGEADGFDPLEFDRYTRFQELARSLAEGINDVSTVQQSLLKGLDAADAALIAQARLSRDMQQQLFAIRTVPFRSLSERLYRILRQFAKDLDKRANLEIRGAQTELDRSVLEKLVGPLEHMLRNALDHGIESRDVRLRAGKPEVGEITLTVRQVGNEIAIELADDGAGLDLANIRARAIAQGRIAPDAQPSPEQMIDLIFQPGLSTATKVTQVSGRGIGMDVVRSEITALGGRVEVASTTGKGTTFLVCLPLTLAVAQAVLVRAGGRLWALPAPMVEQVQQVRDDALYDLYVAGKVEWQGRSYPFHYLPWLLGDTEHSPEIARSNSVLLLRTGHGVAAVHVDEMAGNQEVVVKNIGPQLARVSGIAGATVLGSGEIVLIINPVQLAQRAGVRAFDPNAEERVAGARPVLPPVGVKVGPPLVMVVDDSLTVRKVTTRLLTREGFEVVTARDGVEALEVLQERTPAVILLDIEMPRMDGFEFTKTIKREPKHANIPIVMITSRTADKHRGRARELGVDLYLGKPYREEELLRNLREMLALTA